MKNTNSNPNLRKVVAVSDDGKGHEGVVLSCGHWQKFPTGVRLDWSSTFLKFFNGEKYLSCRVCTAERKSRK